MFQKMMVASGGGGTPEFITPTYSNGNTTFTASWNYDADSVVAYGKLGANVISMIIINGNVHAANNASLLWADYGNFGGTINQTSRSISFTHSQGWSDIVICPIKGTPSVY